MADHYVSLNRGVTGTRQSDFTTGAASAAADQIELRIKDAAGLTKKDALLALNAFRLFIETARWCAAAGLDLKG